MDDNILLGGNIELQGFKDLDGGSMVIVKKMVGNHVRKISDSCDNFERLTINMKKIGSGNNKFEIKTKLIDNGQPYNSEVTDYNLFVTLNKALEKVGRVIQ